MTPGQRIKHLRIERGLSLEQAAALTGGQLAHSTWSRIENGVSEDPHPQKKAAIAEALHCKVSALWPPRYEDKADARFRATVKAHAEHIERDGSLDERQAFGKRVWEVLERIDPRALGEDPPPDSPYEDLWKLALSLLCDPEKRTVTIVDPDGNVHREYDHFTPTTQRRVANAKRARIQARSTRAKAHAAASPTVPTRRRPRERRETRSSSSSSDDPGGEPDHPALSRRTNGQGG